MEHSEALSLAHAGGLEPAKAQALQGHLQACADCRAVLARWDPAWAPPDLAPRVLQALAPAPGWAWLPLGYALAALLALSAFWMPERHWLSQDPGGAAWDGGITEGGRP